MGPAKRLGLRLLTALRLYPRLHFTYSPFKILEFRALMAGLAWRGDERVLDIGCGNGLQTLLIGQRCGEVTGVDVEPSAIADARWQAALPGGRGRATFLSSTVEAAGFADGAFDRIFSICVIEHIPDTDSVLRECRRILRPGGMLRFTVDALQTIEDPELVERHRREHGVQHYFRPDELAAKLRAHGFAGVTVAPLFRSPLARQLFERGIRQGFNFGRLGATRLADRLARDEAASPDSGKGLFLIATATRPQ